MLAGSRLNSVWRCNEMIQKKVEQILTLVALFSAFGAFTIGFEVAKWANVPKYSVDFVSLLLAFFMFSFAFYQATRINNIRDWVDDVSEPDID